MHKRHPQMRAAELNPSDPYNHFAIGFWLYKAAGLSWAQRSVVKLLFGNCPTVLCRQRGGLAWLNRVWLTVSCTLAAQASYEEAYEHFVRAEQTKPKFYVRNTLKLVHCCIEVGGAGGTGIHITTLTRPICTAIR